MLEYYFKRLYRTKAIHSKWCVIFEESHFQRTSCSDSSKLDRSVSPRINPTLWEAVPPRGTAPLCRTDAAAPSAPASRPCSDCCCGRCRWLHLRSESSSPPAATAGQSSAPASESPADSASGGTSRWYSPDWHLRPSCPPAAASGRPPPYETHSGHERAASSQSHSPPCTMPLSHCRRTAVRLCHSARCGGLRPPLTAPPPSGWCPPPQWRNAQSWRMCCSEACWSGTGWCTPLDAESSAALPSFLSRR